MPRRFFVPLAALAGALSLASVALAQSVPVDPPDSPMTAAQWATVTLACAGAFSVLMTAIGQALALAATRWPRLATASHLFVAWGYDVKKFTDRVQAAQEARAVTLAARAAPANDTRPHGFARVAPLAGVALVGALAVFGPPAAVAGCTKAQAASDVAVAQGVLSDADKACVWTEQALLPVLGFPAATVAEIKQVCNLVSVSDAAVAQVLAAGAPGQAPALASVKARLAARRAP